MTDSLSPQWNHKCAVREEVSDLITQAPKWQANISNKEQRIRAVRSNDANFSLILFVLAFLARAYESNLYNKCWF